MEPSIPFHAVVGAVDDDDTTNEKFRTPDLLLEINNVTSKLESKNHSVETFEANAEVMLTQTTGLNNKCISEFLKRCNYRHKSNHSVSNCVRKQHEDEERNRNSYSRSKSLAKSFNQHF